MCDHYHIIIKSTYTCCIDHLQSLCQRSMVYMAELQKVPKRAWGSVAVAEYGESQNQSGCDADESIDANESQRADGTGIPGGTVAK